MQVPYINRINDIPFSEIAGKLEILRDLMIRAYEIKKFSEKDKAAEWQKIEQTARSVHPDFKVKLVIEELEGTNMMRYMLYPADFISVCIWNFLSDRQNTDSAG